MTKEIREGMKSILYGRQCLYDYTEESSEKLDDVLDLLLSLLHSKNVVIKVDGELPDNPYFDIEDARKGIASPSYAYAAEGRESLLKAGFTKTKPLIEPLLERTG